MTGSEEPAPIESVQQPIKKLLLQQRSRSRMNGLTNILKAGSNDGVALIYKRNLKLKQVLESGRAIFVAASEKELKNEKETEK